MFSLKSSRSAGKNQTQTVAVRAPEANPALPAKTKLAAKDFNGFEAIDGEGVVLVGKGTHIVGEITNCSVVEIQGILEGTVSADVVIVRDGGGFKGNFRAEQAQIHGVVEGGVTVHGLLDIRATGKVTGDVTYEELAVAVGAHVSGQIASPATIDAPSVSDAPMDSDAPVVSNTPPVSITGGNRLYENPSQTPPQLPPKHIDSPTGAQGDSSAALMENHISAALAPKN